MKHFYFVFDSFLQLNKCENSSTVAKKCPPTLIHTASFGPQLINFWNQSSKNNLTWILLNFHGIWSMWSIYAHSSQRADIYMWMLCLILQYCEKSLTNRPFAIFSENLRLFSYSSQAFCSRTFTNCFIYEDNVENKWKMKG